MISKHFTESEWNCNCGCGQNIIHPELIYMAETFRLYLNRKYKRNVSLIVHCVNRCITHNRSVGSNDKSLHITGKALDCHAVGITSEQLFDSAVRCHRLSGILWGGLGMYKDWEKPGIHFDIGRFRSW